MADISSATQPTIAAIYAAWEARGNRDKGHRAHLGASVLGNECLAAIWYTFRWCTDLEHEGRLLRLFDRGQLEESRFIQELRWAGIKAHDVDDRTGKQFTFSDCGGHAGGSMDGVGIGFAERPGIWHVLEFKTHNDKSFKELVKKGVKDAKPLHLDQMQLYMHWSGINRAFYMAVNKNDDQLYTERVRYDEKHAARLLQKAWGVVKSPVPLETISQDPAFYKCKMCDHAEVCHTRRLPAVNCRTCLHSTPELDGKGVWTCALKNIELSDSQQRTGCEQHRYIPKLVSWATPVDASEEHNWVEYEFNGERFRNGPKDKDSFPSIELREVVPEMLGDLFAEGLRSQFGAFYADNQENIGGQPV